MPMAIREILKYPAPMLKEKSLEVRAIDEETLGCITDLMDTMTASPGVGLAAPQIGELKRIIAVDVTPKKEGAKQPECSHGLIVLVNPVITRSGGMKTAREGCLSVPEYTADIQRAEEITVKGLDRNGAEVTIESRGFEAVALQHEIDHLDGILFIDRITSVKALFKRKIKEKAG